MGYCLRLGARDLFFVHHSTDKIAFATAFAIPVVELWLEQEIAQYFFNFFFFFF